MDTPSRLLESSHGKYRVIFPTIDCFIFQMEKRMLNTHPEMFNGDYEVEFPLDENNIVKRLDYEDIPVRIYWFIIYHILNASSGMGHGIRMVHTIN